MSCDKTLVPPVTGNVQLGHDARTIFYSLLSDYRRTDTLGHRSVHELAADTRAKPFGPASTSIYQDNPQDIPTVLKSLQILYVLLLEIEILIGYLLLK